MKKLFYLFAFLLLATGSMLAQRSISGKVTSDEGDPLVGATVLAKGTSVGTTTDIDGNYTLSVPQEVTTLIFSYTGYRTVELPIGTSNVLDITLNAEVSQLSEVVVVGYGTQIKSTLSGNISKVGGEEIQGLPVPSVEQALQGKSAGVFIESTNGKPGSAIRVRVRGSSSIGASNQPLFVVDGVPITTASQNISGAPLNPLADLNFNDIESIEILKDASASAIYGSRAANGVVLITTKRGKSGKTAFDVDFQTGFSEPTNRREFLNADQFVTYFTEAANNSDDLEGVPYDDRNSWTTFVKSRFFRYSGRSNSWETRSINTDWQDLAFQTGQSSQASVSARGGTDKTRYFVSTAYSKQEGILINNNFERMSARLNIDQDVTDRITMGLNMSLARTFTDQVSNDNAFSTPMQLVALAPITPPRDSNGILYDRPVTTYYNGLIDVEDAQREVTSFRTLANGYLRIKLLKNLTLNGDLAADVYNLRDNTFFGSRTDAGQATNGFGQALSSQVVNWSSRAFANYTTSINDLHNLNLTAGMELQRSETNSNQVSGQQFPGDDLKTVASAADISFGTSTIDEFSFLSYFSRINYDFNRKYLLTLSGRVDGSSRFGDNNRYGFFPAVSAGWVLSEESFLQGNGLISFLKLRGSYGVTGNAEIGNFNHLGLFNASVYNGLAGLSPNQLSNPDLEWEKTAQTDIGLDFGLFNNRLNGEIDYYIKNTTDLLLDVPVPSTSGYNTITRNIGAIENRGIEIVLNSNNLVGDFTWNTSFNIAFNRNEVKELAEGQTIIDPGSSRNMNVVKVGEPIGVFFGAEYAGVDPDNGDALWYVNKEGRERETTNDFSEAEFVVLGNPNPDFIGGLTNNFGYKGFTLDITFQGVFGNEIHKSGDVFMACNACWFDNQTTDQLNSWKQPGDITNVPEARLGYSNGDQGRSSRYISDGSYLRLRTLTLGYQFPKSVLDKLRLSKLRIFAIGQNLLTFTKYDGWDPEVSSDAFVTNTLFGVDFYSAPQPRTITFGLSVGF
ncbi:MAG: SusC/RagA family TonB-linked outer membrane protein [Saprospiraceae bacterium]